MIHVERPAPPAFLTSPAMKKELERMAAFFKQPGWQSRYDFNISLFKKFKPALTVAFHKKCAYCDRSLSIAGFGNIEQFRPKTVYWWLAYEWENQLISCQQCSQRYKKISFPIAKVQKDSKMIMGKDSQQLNLLEEPLLLNPFTDDPEQHFKYTIDHKGKKAFLVPLTKRAEITIEIIGLNRIELLNERYILVETFETFLKALKADGLSNSTRGQIQARMIEMTSGTAQFAGMIRQLLRNTGIKVEWKIKPGLRIKKSEKELFKIPPAEALSLMPKSPGKLIINKFVPCEITISNFKSISHLHLTFRSLEENMAYAQHRLKPGEDIDQALRESWLLLLGENGVGKSSVLQAVVLALLPQPLRGQYIEDPKALVRIGQKKGFVKIKLGDKEPIIMSFTKGGKITGNIDEYHDYLLAYGATRLLPKGKLQPEPNTSKIKVHNLFDYSISLENAQEWLMQLSPEDFDQAALFLKDILFLKQDILKKDNNIYTQENDELREIGTLSDGHKTLLALSVDMLKTFATQETDSRYRDVQKYASGIVLIDEIGTHLHPRWKMKIVERLRAALPRVFFIVTSHEPLCLRGLRDKEVTVLKREPSTGEISVVTDLPSPDGLRIDQLLTSRYFGLYSTIDPDIEEKFERYYQLLGKPEADRTPEEKTQIEQLQVELKNMNQLGETLREELFYYVIDEVIARQVRKTGMKTKDELKTEVKLKIETLLKEIDINYL